MKGGVKGRGDDDKGVRQPLVTLYTHIYIYIYIYKYMDLCIYVLVLSND